MATKNFKNPLGNYIDTTETTEQTIVTQNNEQSLNQTELIEFDYTKDTKETKSKRVQLVMTPSLYKALKQRAKADKTSVNDFVCQFLQKIL